MEVFNGRLIKVKVENGKEIVEHCAACCILPIDEQGNTFLVEQYRYGISGKLWELPAGKVDEGEEPEACAVRELEEEIGAVCDELVYFGPMIPTAAYCSEIIHLYGARVSTFTDPHPDEGEELEIKKIPFTQLLEMIDRDEITDAKTVMLALKYARLMKL